MTTEEKLYLSKYFEKYNIDIRNLGRKICIVSGVGSGKNAWVEDDLTNLGNVLLLTSRRVVTDEVINRENEFTSTSSYPYDPRCTVMTHAKLKAKIRSSDCAKKVIYDFHEKLYDYIVVDEAHCLICDSTFTDSTFHLWTFINQAVKYSTVILMTACITPIEKILRDEGWLIIDSTNECKNIKPAKVEIIKSKDVMSIIKDNISTNSKAIYLATSAWNIANNLRHEIASRTEIQPDRIACIMSDTKRDEYITETTEIEKSGRCYNEIVKYNKLPDDIEILLTTSRLKEGVNLKDEKIKIIFIESHYSLDIIQFTGRVRTGVEIVYIIDDSMQYNYDTSKLEYEYSQYEILNANNYLESISFKGIGRTDSLPNIYRQNRAKKFIDLIEEKNKFIRFNHFTIKFELYSLRYEGYTHYLNGINSYNLNKIEYLREQLGIDDIIENNNAKILEDYINSNQLQGKVVRKEEKEIILEDLSRKGVKSNRNKPYKNLGALLKANGYCLKRVGNRNDLLDMICKLED